MPLQSSEYTIRRQVFKLFGAAFHVYDGDGNLVGYSKQKAFKLKEDIRIYTDESMSSEVLSIQARQIVDFSAAYDIVDARSGERVGAARRKGWSSIARDSWELLDTSDTPVATVQEDSMMMAMMRHLLSNLIPQNFSVKNDAGTEFADFHQHFNPFIYKLDVTIRPGAAIDPRLILGAAVLICAIEGRQN